VAPKSPNYGQDRLRRERAQAAKAQEKADRRAEKSGRRKAARGEGDPPPEGTPQG